MNKIFKINNNYEIVEKIGEGAFGEVFKIFDNNTSSLRVLKKNKKDSVCLSLEKENDIMKEMSSSEGFAKIVDLEETKDSEEAKNVMIMTCLG